MTSASVELRHTSDIKVVQQTKSRQRDQGIHWSWNWEQVPTQHRCGVTAWMPETRYNGESYALKKKKDTAQKYLTLNDLYRINDDKMSVTRRRSSSSMQSTAKNASDLAEDYRGTTQVSQLSRTNLKVFDNYYGNKDEKIFRDKAGWIRNWLEELRERREANKYKQARKLYHLPPVKREDTVTVRKPSTK